MNPDADSSKKGMVTQPQAVVWLFGGALFCPCRIAMREKTSNKHSCTTARLVRVFMGWSGFAGIRMSSLGCNRDLSGDPGYVLIALEVADSTKRLCLLFFSYPQELDDIFP